ncbi:pyruvate kinase [Rice orange leaf phytoplasma]|uniref:pyruvate kinase n=1 Tax=Rice orange leaf phytoplasma TaxID=146897 RepID=UPI0008F5D5E5|nr:pyruvate kinase [Rice orange leaf phytoplasma]OIJ44900.1 pyruvate kinase [Rice orange leaf phytoplasma]
MNKTKIICTLGPASYDKNILQALIQTGLNVARFNFSHAQYEQTKLLMKTIKTISDKLDKHTGLMLDTKGPEIRTHEFDGVVTIQKDSEVKISMTEVLGNAKLFSVSYSNLYNELKVGDMVNIDDGYLSLEVVGKDEAKQQLVTKAKNTHSIKSRRGVNVPKVNLEMDFISPKDYQDIVFAAQQDFDYIAASFVRRAQDVKDIRKILQEQGNSNIQIISKIENQEGVDNLEEIIQESDGIMVARGDLGIEVDGELVPLYQTRMITKCLEYGKPVVVATQMLESMQRNPRPTKAETSDVFNAVREGTTFTMLSGESASGEYPVEAVTYMKKINYQAEKVVNYQALSQVYQPKNSKENLLLSAVELALRTDVKAIVVYDLKDAYNVSKFHPSVPVLALVKTEQEARRLVLNFGVCPFVSETKLQTKLEELTQNQSSNCLVVKDGMLYFK